MAGKRKNMESLAGDIRLSEVLSKVDLPVWLLGELMGRMLRWRSGWGVERVRDVLAEHRISETKAVGTLTYRQRRRLALAVAASEEGQKSSRKRARHHLASTVGSGS